MNLKYQVEKIEKEEKKAGKSKKNKKVSESENTPALVPSTLKTDNKPVAEEPQKKLVNNVEKVVDNVEESKVVQAQEKTAVFDELGGNLVYFFYRRSFTRNVKYLRGYIAYRICVPDVWTEAKPQKKSKKKARKDN